MYDINNESFKPIISSLETSLSSIYDNFIYLGYISPKYVQMLNNTKLLTAYNLKRLSGNVRIKNDILDYLNILSDALVKIKSEQQDDEAILVYLLSKLFLLTQKYNFNFNCKGKNITLNTTTIESLMIQYDDDIFKIFNEHLIKKVEDDNLEGALSLEDIINLWT